ncbi:putative early protein [Bacillus phage vB_BsuP-Goe15]|nr:putative early protein [Bacillus phage vB_BsuP-Goe15]
MIDIIVKEDKRLITVQTSEGDEVFYTLSFSDNDKLLKRSSARLRNNIYAIGVANIRWVLVDMDNMIFSEYMHHVNILKDIDRKMRQMGYIVISEWQHANKKGTRR